MGEENVRNVAIISQATTRAGIHSPRCADLHGGADLIALTKHLRRYHRAPTVCLGLPTVRQTLYPSGLASLDHMLGGGLPGGGIVEFNGATDSGKSTLALQVAASAQEAGHSVLFIDTDCSLDARYAKSLGVQEERFAYAQLTTYRSVFDGIVQALRRGVGLVVLDSLSAIVRSGTDDDIEHCDSDAAEMITNGFKRLLKTLSDNGAMLLVTNQLKRKPEPSLFGNPEEPTGGHAVKHYPLLRLALFRIGISRPSNSGVISRPGEVDLFVCPGRATGSRHRIRVLKSKTGDYFSESTIIQMVRGQGFCMVSDLFTLGLRLGLIRECGGALVFQEESFEAPDGFLTRRARLDFLGNTQTVHGLISGIESRLAEIGGIARLQEELI